LKAVSTINAIISEATNQPKVAVITVPLNATSHTINFSQIVESAEKLRQQTVRFEEGMKPNAEEIVRIQEEFHTVRTEVETAYNSVRLQRGNFTDIDDGETARSIFEKTVEAINVQPHGALAVQGNVFPSRADELVG
ncbi:MAG: hypothetical protein N2316_04890, partial [Spirochaetes bacterium]|nr:hypothetical protein [Spirochaetota bacterium]